MNDFLWQTYHRLIAETELTNHRFLYDQLNLEHRLTGIIGARGVGKTTLLLQYIKEKLYTQGNAFYFSADSIYFNSITMLEYVDQLYRTQHIQFFFIDEIHKYANWNQELKNIYDAFPKIKIVFSGSSSIDLIEGTYDLSRRARLLFLPGLSFREYLNFKTDNQFPPITFEDLLTNHQALVTQLSSVTTIAKHFEEYMAFGYYPIVFENRDNLYSALSNVIEKTIYEDIANFYNLKTENLSHFKRIINFLANIPPGKVNINNVAKNLSIDNKTAAHYLKILSRSSMIRVLSSFAHGNQILRKPEKIYLDNTTLLSAVSTMISDKIDIGTLRELVFLQLTCGAGLPVFYSEVGDFLIKGTVFEVGGKNKTWQQLKAHNDKKILVKDNILIGSKNEIPLYLFGFLY
ncbi:MAG: ATP-binding protein [Gammaproteobacteria bacterium]